MKLSTAIPYWKSESLFDAPAMIQSAVYSEHTYSGFPSPISDGLSSTVEGNDSRACTVVGLFCSSSPSAIVGIIHTIVVDSFYGMLRSWACPHIGDKISKVIPSLANLNSPSAIAVIVRAIGVVASVTHLRPYKKFRCLAFSMREIQLANPLDFDAATRLCMSTFKFSGSSIGSSSAFTLALPIHRPSPSPSASFNHSEFPELFPNKIIHAISRTYNGVMAQ